MTTSTHAAAAKMIRAELKKNGIPAKVRARTASMMTAVDVYVTDLPPATMREVKAYAGQFQYGHFDGMIDCYEYSNRNDELPQVKFVMVENRMSDELRAEIEAWIESYYAPSCEIDAWQVFSDDSRCGFGSRFWADRKPRMKAAA